jgi:serine phosphatase RsbU (regulator of sigma subunit)
VDWAQVASTAAGVDVIGCLFAILLGYVFFVRFVRKQGLHYFRVQTEIELAEQIHRSLVPPIVRRGSQDEFYGLSAPSGEMGGDLVDLVQDGDKWIAYLADVSGHGVPSGVLMAMVKSAVRMRLATSSEPQVLLESGDSCTLWHQPLILNSFFLIPKGLRPETIKMALSKK